MNIKSFLTRIAEEEKRNEDFLHVTAYEARMSETARKFLGSTLHERYFIGGGNNGVVDKKPFTALGHRAVEDLVFAAENAAKEMLSASLVNLNVLTGVHAMMCTILSTTEPGDTVMTLPMKYGGHFATKSILDRIGRKHVYLDYELENLRFDTQKIARKFKKAKARAIYLDVSYYLNPHNLVEIREAVGEEAIIIYDASHTIGLIMGQEFQAPLEEGADVISANTHKTLPGPHKGMIAFKEKELGEKANQIINGCLFSTRHITHLIALAITILEMKAYGKSYAKQVVANSNEIAHVFENLNYEVRKANSGRYSDNHQAHIFIDNKGKYPDLYKTLIRNNISTNFDNPLGDRVFIRIGTQEVTRRGMKEAEMKNIAHLMHRAMSGEDVKKEVIELNRAFPNIHYSFDEMLNERENRNRGESIITARPHPDTIKAAHKLPELTRMI
jgi:glycine/serine hydroxymethyltransferase